MAPCDLTTATTTLWVPLLKYCKHERLTNAGGASSPFGCPVVVSQTALARDMSNSPTYVALSEFIWAIT